MKIDQQLTTKVFQPVAFQFTFETQEELDAFGTLFNFAPITDALDKMGLSTGSAYSDLQKAGANIHKTDEFHEKLMKTSYMATRWMRK